jgi:hypothetical protein
MQSFESSFDGLFASEHGIRSIEIPLIQRDYAQGRQGVAVERIRTEFLDVLHGAATGGEPVSLDFVYGSITGGTLEPLDGQQRLTTLFLLHWYVAARADRLGEARGWKNFRYATRASARYFCERLVAYRPPFDGHQVSAWIRDQPWYRYTWRHDPTIQSMLVMLDAIDARFREADASASWQRLVDPRTPAITFRVLATDRLGPGEELYIKMNSRGRPLTAFENFKARFEQLLKQTDSNLAEEFEKKVDGEWSNLLWRHRRGGIAIDDAFMRYFLFVTEVCEWRDALPAEELQRLDGARVDSRARRAFQVAKNARDNVGFLFRAFDLWGEQDVSAFFQGLFASAPAPLDSEDVSRVVLHDPEIDLFTWCCRRYGEKRDFRRRWFSFQQALLLYAVLYHRLNATDDPHRRLRALRNLLAASDNEVRQERMPTLLGAVERLVWTGDVLSGADPAFNKAQIADELRKRARIGRTPAVETSMFRLEDHRLLRGCLAAFDVESPAFERRAEAFHGVFDPACLPAVTGALLACGDYSRKNRRFHQLGSPKNDVPWRALLTSGGADELMGIRTALERLLDGIAVEEGTWLERIERVRMRWIDSQELFEWRYYFVKYPLMRDGGSGLYASASGALGFDLCMMDRDSLRGYYRDPYLTAVLAESEDAKTVTGPWFTGYEHVPRFLRLRSGAGMRCVAGGFMLEPPADAAQSEIFKRICSSHGAEPAGVLPVTQVTKDGRVFDTRDRVQLGAALIRELVEAGL